MGYVSAILEILRRILDAIEAYKRRRYRDAVRDDPAGVLVDKIGGRRGTEAGTDNADTREYDKER